jgi:hypothetical protein
MEGDMRRLYFVIGWFSLLVAGLLSMQVAQARPFRGSAQWSWLLCKTSDAPAPAFSAARYTRMMVQLGQGGLADYWREVSYNSINVDGSAVHGWYTLSQTTAQMNALDRWGRVNACRNAAATAGYTPPAGNQVGIITQPAIDMFGWSGGAFLPPDIDVGGAAHESGHGIGLNHSFSNDPNYRNADWAQIGEYDNPWDVMSWANCYSAVTAAFGNGPLGLTAFHLDRMGWLPRSRIITFGADGVSSKAIMLSALNAPSVSGSLIVRIPFDPGDLQRHYTVEYRRKSGWDAGIPQNTVMINEVKRHDDGVYYAHLLYSFSPKQPLQILNANGITVSVTGISPSGSQATVAITSQMPDRCLQGYVWREANVSDHVCVVGAVRTETAQENSLAASHRSPTGGAYGADTCLQGYVWREAYAGDHVCVTATSRTRAAADNADAVNRNNPARIAYGPNTCKVGYVWREADDKDWVCVTGQIRQQTADENAQAASHRSPTGGAYGLDTCLSGYVWRDAFPNDHICVTVASRTQAANDNAQAQARLLVP